MGTNISIAKGNISKSGRHIQEQKKLIPSKNPPPPFEHSIITVALAAMCISVYKDQ